MRTIRRFDLADGQEAPWIDGALEEILNTASFSYGMVLWAVINDGDDEEEEE